MIPRKIAFVKSGSFSHINASVEAQLRTHFPGCEVVVFDVREKLRRSPLAVMCGLAQAAFRRGTSLRADPLDCIIQTPATFQFIRKWICRAVRAPGFLFTFQTQSMWDASVAGVPHFIYTDHTELTNRQYPDFDPHKLIGGWWTELESQIYRRATVTLTMSAHVTRSLIEDYGCQPSQVVRVGAGSNASVKVDSATDAARYRQKNILFVGLDWERKGGPQLAAAFKRVLQSHPDAKLTVVGCNPKLDLPNCRIMGRLPLADMAQAYATASIFCLPTRQEPFGIVLIEAMLSGLAIVATDLGAVTDLVENGTNGQRVQVNDIEGLADALNHCLNDPERLELMGQNSARQALKHHTWERVGARIRDVIQSHIPAFSRKSVSEEPTKCEY